ncbi:ZDHHC6 [Bugula neritina]|uniref:Palmitoyltransferase n=1 Tax=Bugula neritina TaxID=10212 RepID=A0A7J7K402_BUGNE|nr:ZDHHC6 [Bugula neritina]
MFWPIDADGGITNLAIFLTWVFLVFYHHYRASAIGPGFVPLKWKPRNPKDCDKLQFCLTCQGYKAPRSHHCRKCNRCVMKMDHHCPWINVCCGHMNHASFTYFLFFAPVGCIHAFYILAMSLYYGFNIRWYIQFGDGTEPRVIFSLYTLIGSMFAIGLAFGIIISVGILLIVQTKAIWRNRTGIEDWIEQKSTYRDRDDDFVYPYDLGVRRNISQVLFTSNGWPKSNGFYWDVKEGCTQFDLTIEQKLQKADKKARSLEYVGIKNYSGSFFPITHGPCVCCCFPWSDEPRVPIAPGDRISVTRWRKRWLYGDKIFSQSKMVFHQCVVGDNSVPRERGWFPKHCVASVAENNGSGDGKCKKN